MNNSIRNGIVLENILPLIEDLQSVVRLSAVCKRWYEQINNDTILWRRLVQLEQIEDPEYWYRVDDNVRWRLGTPCKPKNILLNYRRTYFCIKHNIYKKYEFICDNNDVFEYDGKTLLFTRDCKLHIYKVTKDSLELFQKINLKIHGITAFMSEHHCILINNDYIVIIDGFGNIITYRLVNNEYVFIQNQLYSDFEYGFWDDRPSGKLLHSNVLIGTYYQKEAYTVVAWDLSEDRLIFNAVNHKFIKYDNSVLYVYDIETDNIVLYNEEYQVIYRIVQSLKIGFTDLIVTDNLLHIVYNHGLDCFISSWDRSTGQMNTVSQRIRIDEKYLKSFSLRVRINKNRVMVKRSLLAYDRKSSVFPLNFRKETTIEAYNSEFQHIWSLHLPAYHVCKYYSLFNKLIIVKESRESKQCSLEFRDIDNGHAVFNAKIFKHFWKLNKDLMVFRPDKKRLTLLSYR